MYSSQLNYVALAWPFFSFLVGLFLVLVVLTQVHALRFAYMRLGVSSGNALLLLLGSLIGSYINIPVATLPEQCALCSTMASRSKPNATTIPTPARAHQLGSGLTKRRGTASDPLISPVKLCSARASRA